MISLEPITGLSMGDTNNCRFGGTQPGWMGDRSVPTTRALGYSSAKSLRGLAGEFPQRIRFSHNIHGPDACVVDSSQY